MKKNRSQFKIFILFVTLFFTAFCVHYDFEKEKKSSSLNKIIGDLALFPINSNGFRLSELENIKAIVFVMRERSCPISEKYGPRLTRLEEKYSKKGIYFIYNYVGRVKAEESGKKDLEKFNFKGPYLIDKKQTIMETLDAKTTGEVFVLTPRRRIIYRGPIDDQYYLLKSRIKPKNHYLSDILERIASGKPIIQKELPAPGCLIERIAVKKKSPGLM